MTEKQKLFRRLVQNPARDDLREKLRALAQEQNFNGIDAFYQRFETIYKNQLQNILQNAAKGWQYSWIIDGDYLDGTLEKILSSEKSYKSSSALGASEHSAAGYIDSILAFDDIQACWDFVREIVRAENDVLLVDDYKGIRDDDLPAVLQENFTDKALNVTILGAGCVGLTLANALKAGLKDKVNILVIENRVQDNHVKQPFSRDWLTNIPSGVLQGVIAGDVMQIFDDFGAGGFIGVPLHMSQTCLFLSCRKHGVKFLFQDSTDLSFLDNVEPGLLFDATAGAFQAQELNPYDHSIDVPFPDMPQYGAECTAYGVQRAVDVCGESALLKSAPDAHDPYVETNKLIKQAMFKITHIPLHLYEPLLQLVQGDNDDAMTYIWKGTLRSEFNQVMLLFNLTKPCYEALANALNDKETLAVFLEKHVDVLVDLDPRVERIIKLLREEGGDLSSVMIEPPFLYAPRVHIPFSPLRRLHDWQVLPIGDSLYQGNPKVGNGLGFHLAFVRLIHDHIMNLFGR